MTPWRLGTHLFWGQKVKVTSHKNHCRCGSFHSYECWLLLVGLVSERASSLKRLQQSYKNSHLACDYQGKQVAQLFLTNPRDALHHDKRQNFKSHVTITTSFFLVICHPVARIDIAYSCTKFDDFRFSHSSDMIGAPKIL